MAEGILGGIAAAVPLIASGISSAVASGDSQKNRDFSNNAAELAWSRNVDLWKATNEYNSPAATMKRFKDAGLNPNLIYGAATGNVAQQPHAAEAAVTPAAPARPDLGHAAAQSIAAFNDLRLGAAQTSNTDAQTSLAIQSATSAAIHSTLEQLGFGTKQDLDVANTNLAVHQASAADANANKANMEAMVGFNRDEREALSSAVSLKEAVQRIANMRIEAAALQQKTPAEIAKMRADTERVLNDSKISVMDQTMRNNGVMPHDNVFYRSVSGILNSIFPWSSSITPTTTGGHQQPSKKVPTNPTNYDQINQY